MELPFMILPNATLFPNAMMPLYIFEKRYRQMLCDTLEHQRMFGVVMNEPGQEADCPRKVGGMGFIRAAVTNDDGTSHLVLQGVSRVQLDEVMFMEPYPKYRVRHLNGEVESSVMIDAYTAKLLELVQQRLKKGFLIPMHIAKKIRECNENDEVTQTAIKALNQNIQYLAKRNCPGQLSDLISCTLLSLPTQRQTLLETINVEQRMKCLIEFLLSEIGE